MRVEQVCVISTFVVTVQLIVFINRDFLLFFLREASFTVLFPWKSRRQEVKALYFCTSLHTQYGGLSNMIIWYRLNIPRILLSKLNWIIKISIDNDSLLMFHKFFSCTDHHEGLTQLVKVNMKCALTRSEGGKWHNHLCDLVHCSPVESVSAQSCLLASVSPSPPVVSLELRCTFGLLERPAAALLRRSLPVSLHKRKDIKISYLIDMVQWALSSVLKDGCDYFYVRDCEISSNYLDHDWHFIKWNKVLTTMSYYCMSRESVFCSVPGKNTADTNTAVLPKNAN